VNPIKFDEKFEYFWTKMAELGINLVYGTMEGCGA